MATCKMDMSCHVTVTLSIKSGLKFVELVTLSQLYHNSSADWSITNLLPSTIIYIECEQVPLFYLLFRKKISCSTPLYNWDICTQC